MNAVIPSIGPEFWKKSSVSYDDVRYNTYKKETENAYHINHNLWVFYFFNEKGRRGMCSRISS